MRRCVWLLGILAVSTVAAGCGGGRRAARCPAPPAGDRNAYLPRLSSASGPAHSTVTVSARLPLFDEAGKYAGPGTPHVSAYWNLDVDRWWSVLKSPTSPAAAVTGERVDLVGRHHAAGGCDFRMRVRIPTAPPGRYPLVFVYRYRGASDADGPVSFRVTSG